MYIYIYIYNICFIYFFVYLSFSNKNALYLVPLISLFGSVILSFHAYFLIFSRNYTEFIEQKINNEFDDKILIAHELENDYFFPTKQKKIVVAVFNKNFSWFSFVTFFVQVRQTPNFKLKPLGHFLGDL